VTLRIARSDRHADFANRWPQTALVSRGGTLDVDGGFGRLQAMGLSQRGMSQALAMDWRCDGDD